MQRSFATLALALGLLAAVGSAAQAAGKSTVPTAIARQLRNAIRPDAHAEIARQPKGSRPRLSIPKSEMSARPYNTWEVRAVITGLGGSGVSNSKTVRLPRSEASFFYERATGKLTRRSGWTPILYMVPAGHP
jgi:hypothetical protein